MNKSNETLFNVDVNAIKSTLESANQILKENGLSLIGKYELLPSKITFDKDFDDSVAFIQESEKFLDESKKFRLSNGKPFREATKVINDYYKSIDEPVEQELRIVKERINTKALEEYEIKQEHEKIEKLAIEDENDTIVSTSEGEVIVDVDHHQDSELTVELSKSKVKMHYKVTGYNLADLDLNQLANYFTDSAILSACRKHMKNENKKINGIEYKTIAME